MTQKEAIKILKDFHDNSALFSVRTALETLHPELKESDDERIRKELIKFVKVNIPNEERYISWLEKQGEPKILGIGVEHSSGILKECLDKVTPKFKVGDWITDGDYTWKIVAVKPLDYILQSQDGNIVDDTISYVDEQFHSFTIKDAKNGDVLISTWKEHSYIYIFKEIESNAIVSHVYYYPELNTISYGIVTMTNTPTKPVTKEKYDTLIKAMSDAGYTFDFEKKEFKEFNTDDLIEESYQQQADDLIDNVTEKPTWDKNDDIHQRDAIYAAENIYTDKCGKEELVHWLKSLKDRVQPQPKQEWSEEDERRVEDTIYFLETAKKHYASTVEFDACIDWLKSLKPQNTWKPNDEQIKAIRLARSFVTDDFGDNPTLSEILIELEKQLKKLKENKL